MTVYEGLGPPDEEEIEEPRIYHGPGPHADDCDCADCLALLPVDWFADYDRYLSEEAAGA